MTPAERYRVMALEFRAKASGENDGSLRTEWENLALAYFRLSEQAEKNALTDIVYETMPKPSELKE